MYREVPRQSKQEYEAEKDRYDNQWVTTAVLAGVRYPEVGIHKNFLNYTLIDIDKEYLKFKQDHNYLSTVIPTFKQVFVLDEYVTHPEWVKHWKYQDTFDIYVEKNNQGRVMTMIRCKNAPPKTWNYRCDMQWSLEPYMNKVALRARFSRVHLKDWQIIQQQSEKILKSTVVDPKSFKFIHPYGAQ